MDLENIYKRVENPIDDDERLKDIVEAVCKCGITDIPYKKIQDVYQNKRRKIKNKTGKDIAGEINKEDEEKFYKLLNDEYRKNHPTEAKLPIEQIQDNWCKAQMKDTISGDPGFYHIKSRNIKGKNNEKEDLHDIKHRLYFDIKEDYLYEFMISFSKKCLERNIPFYFKFSPTERRDDRFLIYSTEKYLGKYIDIVDEIKKEKPYIASTALPPPILTGRIDNWMGYAVEPNEKKQNGKNYSYTEHRTEAIDHAVTKETKRILKNNQNKNIHHRQLGNITMNRYLAKKILDNYFNSTIPEYLKKYGFEYKQYGKEYMQLLDQLTPYIPNFIEEYTNNKKITNIILTPPTGSHPFKISGSELKDGLASFMGSITKEYKSISNRMRQSIKSELDKNGIVPDKMFIDKVTIEKTASKTPNAKNQTPRKAKKVQPDIYDPEIYGHAILPDEFNKPNENKELEEMLKETKQQAQPRPRDIYETDEEYNNYLKDYYGNKFKETKKPRPREVYETDEEYNNYLKEFYNNEFNGTKKK